MKTEEITVRKGFSAGATRIISSILWLACFLSTSCEIEDDFGKPDNSEYYGTEFYTSLDYLMKIIWSEGTNEIIAINSSTIEAIDVTTNTIRQISLDPAFQIGSELIWIDGDILYFVTTNSELTSINVRTSDINKTLVDSVLLLYGYNSNPLSGNTFAFNKQDTFDPSYEPYLFLYDSDTKKETLITSGVPIVFSPDGKTLLFTREYSNYFFYDLSTKTIHQAQFQNYYGNGVIRWTSEGILFFFQNGSTSVSLFNASTNETIGEWESIAFPSLGSIASSGDKIIIQKAKCSIPFVTGYCTFMKQHYYLVDIPTNTETEMAYGNYPNISQLTISPAGNSIALVLNNNRIFLAEEKD